MQQDLTANAELVDELVNREKTLLRADLPLIAGMPRIADALTPDLENLVRREFRAPYPHHFTTMTATETATADSDADWTGQLNVSAILFNRDGSCSATAGVGVAFSEDHAGDAWISPTYVASATWLDLPQLAATSLSGGCGIRVGSWDMKGQSRINEIDHHCDLYSHSSAMLCETYNQNWPDPDTWSSSWREPNPQLVTLRPDRLYVGWVWCYARVDAREMTIHSQVKNSLSVQVESIAVIRS